jgi:hypothetical protein
LGEQMFDADQVLILVRNAFVITLHQFVEQRIGTQFRGKKYEQAKALAWLKRFAGHRRRMS